MILRSWPSVQNKPIVSVTPTMSVCPPIWRMGNGFVKEIKAIRCRRSIQMPWGCRYYTDQKDGIQPTKHTPHVLMPVALCPEGHSPATAYRTAQRSAPASFSVSGLSFTTLEYKAVSHGMATAQLDDVQGLQGPSIRVWG